MAEELKDRILKFLEDKRGQKFNIRTISKELGISYVTCLKWVEVLIAENKIRVEDYGNVKLVWVEENERPSGEN